MSAPAVWARRVAVAVPAAAAAVAVLSGPALAASGLDPIVPEGRSPEGFHIWQLYIVISIPAIVIFLLVEGLLLVIIVRDRRKRVGPDYKPPQWHGHAGLELSWTVAPFLIVGAIFAVSVVELVNDFAPSAYANADMQIDVSGHQFGWVFTYPEGFKVKSDGLKATPMAIPVGRLVRMRLHSTDVIHGFWVPNLQGKTDLVPGYDNFTWLKVDSPGLWRGQCTELCGTGHYSMQILVQAMSQTDYDAWVQKQEAAAVATPTPSPSASASPSPSASPNASPSPSPSGSPSPSPQ
ncbi:MAG: cytochrome c oxidase subunit II [Candidatus Dormibacteraeota bacterium]|nr:cytochrome c oxidase subunit II [Candidatus Dormibacteraeota bacterium]